MSETAIMPREGDKMENTYIAIDLKSFYASVECVERGLDPMNTNLAVADSERTEKTICLAVSPSLKKYGIPGRPRLFEVNEKIREENAKRRSKAPRGRLVGSSYFASELNGNPALEVDYIAATPRMALYMEYSTRIYGIYLRHVAPEDIHVYSIDEVFIDATPYLSRLGMRGREFARRIISEILSETGITATAGIGTNLYLCKVAMDIVAKHTEPDSDGVRIAELDEHSYRELLWSHRPITDFWRVGRGYARTLEAHGIFTMGDVALCSLGGEREFHNEMLLYKLFGVNAELLIDHAWGYEPCRMSDIKAYRPEAKSIGSGQVLHCPYPYEKAELIVREMADLLALDLLSRGLVTDQLVLTVGYDIENLKADNKSNYNGEITVDYYGRRVPKHAHGTESLSRHTSSARLITEAACSLFARIANRDLLVRRINISANRVISEAEADAAPRTEQLTVFDNGEETERRRAKEDAELNKERKKQTAILGIKKRFGKNAIMKGMNLEEGATAKDRNSQIGGHKA